MVCVCKYHLTIDGFVYLNNTPGFHFAANWTASVEFLDTLASSKLRSLMQFLLNMAYFTAGSGVGNLWFSIVYEEKGGQPTYSRGLWLCVLDFILIWVLGMYNMRGKFDRTIVEVGTSSV